MNRIPGLALLLVLFSSGCAPDTQVPETQSAVPAWQGELPIAQPWWRERLPDNTLVYLRLPNPVAMLAMPKGNVLDPALRSRANVENVQALQQGLLDNVLPLLPDETQAYLRVSLEHLRSPLEVSASFIPAPSTVIAATTGIRSAEVLEGLIGEIGLTLSAPLDADGNGQLTGLGMAVFLHFEPASGRLLLHTGPGANAGSFETLLENAGKTTAHPLQALESEVDASGQGLFFWISGRESLPLLRMFVPGDTYGQLVDLGMENLAGVAIGWGFSRGKGRIALAADLIDDQARGLLPRLGAEPAARSAGEPDGVVLLSLPDVAEFERLEALALDGAPPQAVDSWQSAQQLLDKHAGIDIRQFLAALGPDVIGIFDAAGDYAAIRIRDARRFDQVVERIAAAAGSGVERQQRSGRTYYHLALPTLTAMGIAEQAATNGDDKMAQFAERLRQHYYWRREGDYVYLASTPQVLFDRDAIPAGTDIGDWLNDTQRIDVRQAAFAVSGKSRKMPARLYAAYIEAMNMAADFVAADVDIWAMPTARELGLPETGTLGLVVNLGHPRVGAEFTFESNPAETLGGMQTVAVVGILAAIAIPAYQDYTVRAQISEGLALSSDVKIAVTAFRLEHGRFPPAAEAGDIAGLAGAGQYVESVAVEPDSGIIVVTYSDEVVGGGALYLVPAVSANGSVDWACESTYDNKHLPVACRR